MTALKYPCRCTTAYNIGWRASAMIAAYSNEGVVLHGRHNQAQSCCLIEDHEDTRELMLLFLASEFTVKDFTNAPSLLRALETERFDLIVADIMLPELSGYELIKSLKNDPRFQRIPVIALTALAMSIDRDKVVHAGFAEYLVKPIPPQVVVDTIWNCLKSHRQSTAS